LLISLPSFALSAIFCYSSGFATALQEIIERTELWKEIDDSAPIVMAVTVETQ
jgi:hypothetical protein